MDDKLKIFWNLEVLVKMSRSKNDGPSLRIEELEIENKIKNYRQEIEEIESISDEENYDTSAEMADRNIEIITKKQIQVLRNELKEKNKELTEQKNEESTLYEKTNLLRENINSQEKYIESMQERVGELVDIEILDRYNGLIAETTEKVNLLKDELDIESNSYTQVQENIVTLTEKIRGLEEKIAKKRSLLLETQASLENKSNYIDHTKTEKNAKRVKDLESKIEKLNSRIDIIRQDPQYLETKIKDVINNKTSNKKAKPFLIDLINQVIRVPYINVPTDNILEEELLRATQARDSFANEIDQKTYNILEADTPEKLRIEFLTERIAKWKEQLEIQNKKIAEIDHDEQYNYERKERILSVMINSMKTDVKEFERAYEDVPDTNIGAKASIKAALEEKKEDLIEAEKIATLFRKDEAEDIANATRIIKYECDQINKNIIQANDEIQKITNRLTSKKSGLIDISTRNKDKDILKELAQIVIDIKHRRQFPETPLEIIERLEEDLNLNLRDNIDMDVIEETNELIPKNYEEYYTKNSYNIDEVDNNINIDINEDYYNSYDESIDNSSVNRFEETYNRLIKGEEAASQNSEGTWDESYDYNQSMDGNGNYEEYQDYNNYEDYDDNGETFVYESGYENDYENYDSEYPEDAENAGYYEYDETVPSNYIENQDENVETSTDEESDESTGGINPEPIADTALSEDEEIDNSINTFYNNNEFISDHSESDDYIQTTENVEENEATEPIVELENNDYTENYDTSENENNAEITEESAFAQEEPIVETNIEEENPNILEETSENVIENTPVEEISSEINDDIESLDDIGNEPSVFTEDTVASTIENSEFQPYNEELSFESIDNNLDSMTTDAIFAKAENDNSPEENTFDNFENQNIENSYTAISEQPTENEMLDELNTSPVEDTIPVDSSINDINDFNADAVIDSLIDNSPTEIPENNEQIAEFNQESIDNNAITIGEQPYQDIQPSESPIDINNIVQDTQPEQNLETENEYIELSSEPVNNQAEYPTEDSMLAQDPLTTTSYATTDETQQLVENINTETQNSDNIYSNEQLENELDNYISSLETENS